MKEIPENDSEQEVSGPVSKWIGSTVVAMGLVLASCNAVTDYCRPVPKVPVAKAPKIKKPLPKDDIREVMRLYAGLDTRVILASYYAGLYTEHRSIKHKKKCLSALSEAKRFFRMMILPRKFYSKDIARYMDLLKRQTEVKLRVLESKCGLDASTVFYF